jgi:hypothetical protein
MSRDRFKPPAERVVALPLESRQGVKATHKCVLKHILGVDALPDRWAEPTANRAEQVLPQGLEGLSEGLRVATSGPFNEVFRSSLVWHDRVHYGELSFVALDGLADSRGIH